MQAVSANRQVVANLAVVTIQRAPSARPAAD
jgi:hypothetical protein